MSKSCICYVRTGTENPNQFHEQVASVEKFAKENGYEISQIFDDYGVSGNKCYGREGLDDAMNHINEHPEISALIVDDVDRLTRSQEFYVVIRGFLKDQNVRLLSVKQLRIQDTPEQNLLISIVAGMNAFERRMLNEKMKEAIRAKIEGGEVPFSLPLGYKRNGERVEVDKEAAKNVTQIFKLYQSGNYTVSALTKYLNERNIRAAEGNSFTKPALLSLLSNPFYVGRIAFRGERYEGRHPALVSREVFDRCQMLLQSRHTKQEQRILAKAL